MTVRHGIWKSFAAALVAVTVSSAGAQDEPPPQAVRVEAAKLERVEQWRPVTGELRTARRASLAAEGEGLVVEITVREGDQVTAGQTIARLRDVLARIEVDRAKARVRAGAGLIVQREAELAELRLDLTRTRELFDKGSAAQNELDRAETAVKAADALLTQAQAALAAEEAELARDERHVRDLEIRAPFDGVVVAKQTELGQWVNQGDPVVELVSLTEIEAWIDVPERYVDRLRDEALQVRIQIEATGETLEAPVSAVVPEIDPLSRLFPVRVRLNNEAGRLKPGMSVTGVVPTGDAAESLIIAKDAILRDDVGQFVYHAAGAPGAQVAAVARVEVLFATGAAHVVVRSPQLAAGSLVVIEGNERMGYPGRALIVTNAPQQASAPAEPGDGEPGQGG